MPLSRRMVWDAEDIVVQGEAPADPDTRKSLSGGGGPWLVSKAPHDVSAQARDQIGRFAGGQHQRTVSGVTWERSPAAADAGEVLIDVDTLAMDAAWRKDKHYYLAFGGEDKTKYQQAKDFILSGERAVHAPRVHLDVKTGALSFIDGRNRAAVCRDMDLRKLCVTVAKEDAERTRAALGTAKAKAVNCPWLVVKAGHDVSGEPRDERGEWTEGGGAEKPAEDHAAHLRALDGQVSARLKGGGFAKSLAREQWYRISRVGEAIKLIPRGSKFLGAGTEAVAFQTPAGDVVRLELNGRPRPDIPEVLQPTAVRDVTEGGRTVRVERLPLAKKVPKEQLGQAIQSLHGRLRQAGYAWKDDKSANVGLVGGEVKIIDPGNIERVAKGG